MAVETQHWEVGGREKRCWEERGMERRKGREEGGDKQANKPAIAVNEWKDKSEHDMQKQRYGVSKQD